MRESPILVERLILSYLHRSCFRSTVRFTFFPWIYPCFKLVSIVTDLSEYHLVAIVDCVSRDCNMRLIYFGLIMYCRKDVEP